ncbi:MAG: LysR family transcriptional regulator, partial [Acetobacteraceae bacterium]|nr:LysR family transcriptional regulator [Acetobacteraceae bacterium]
AARRLNTSLATVSRKVSELESHLRTKLFDRSSRKLVLTEAGSTYVAACKRILADVTEAEHAASGQYAAPTGELIITAPIGLGRLHLIPILKDFFAAYPDIDIRLVLSDRLVSIGPLLSVERLLEDHIDLALRIGELPSSSLMARRVGSVRHVVCASPSYLAAHGTPQTPDDLAGHDCISYDEQLARDLWTFVRPNANVAIPVRTRLMVSNPEAAREAAQAGVGITMVFSYLVAEALAAGGLVTILDEFRPPALPVHLVYTAARYLPIKVRAFLDFATPRLKARLGQ